ncbi:Fatty acid 2-hydroxylase, partial [Pseudolycoriella hygida]
HLVDWSKPMLGQIGSLKEHYSEWVNKPVDRPLRLFGPDYLEVLTKTPWWAVPLFWIPVIIYITHIGWNEAQAKDFGSIHSVSSFVGGIIVWTILEYSLHRWVFHLNAENGGVFICTFHFLLHGLHHKVPFDPYRLVFPPFPATILATLFYQPLPLLASSPKLMLAGGLLGYLCYDMIHYYIHYGSPTVQYMYNLKRYHYQHHFVRHDAGFGISSPHLVDWSKPMLRQIGSLKEHYTEWVNKPVDRPLRLFESDLKEMLSKTPWWIIPLIWVPTITYLAYIGWYQAEAQGFGHTHSYLSFGGGIFLWTITEYLMHRFIFHVNTENAGVFLCTFHFLFHGLHHKVPFDPYRLVFPPFPAAVIASLSSVPMYFLFSCPALVLAGFVLGYLCYDMMHYYIHYGSPTFKYTYYLKRSHNQHHFVKPNGGFGISCPMWDVVFGTRLFLRKLNYMLKW